MYYNNTHILFVCNFWDFGNVPSWCHASSFTLVGSFAWQVVLTASWVDRTHGSRRKAFRTFSQVTWNHAIHITTVQYFNNELIVSLNRVELFLLQMGCGKEECLRCLCSFAKAGFPPSFSKASRTAMAFVNRLWLAHRRPPCLFSLLAGRLQGRRTSWLHEKLR